MAAARIDGSAMNAQRAAQAAARDHARSAVLGRFDAADARRQFSLDQADEARADRAAGLARSRTDAANGAPQRAEPDDRAGTPTVGREDRATDGHRPDPPRKDTSRVQPGGAHSAAARGPSADSASKAAPTTKADGADGGTAAAAETAPSETAADAKPSADSPAPIVAPPIHSPAAPPPTLAEPPPPGSTDAARAVAQSDTEAVAAPTGDVADGAAASIGEIANEAAQQPAATRQAGAPDAGASFSAILEAVETPPASTASATASAAAKAAGSAESTESAANAAPVPSSSPAVPLGAVPMTIALRSLQNASRFEIRLDPVELGRIDVRLDIDKESGTVSADLVVDRPATLALLQRDASILQQALAQTGLDAGAGIGLSLREGGGEQDRGGGSPRHQPPASQAAQPRAAATTDPGPLRALRLSGLDIRI